MEVCACLLSFLDSVLNTILPLMSFTESCLQLMHPCPSLSFPSLPKGVHKSETVIQYVIKMWKCKAHLELSSQRYISRLNFAFSSANCNCPLPSCFFCFPSRLPSASTQRPVISQTQTRDVALREGPGSEYFSMHRNDRWSTHLSPSINYSKMLVELSSHLSHFFPSFYPFSSSLLLRLSIFLCPHWFVKHLKASI